MQALSLKVDELNKKLNDKNKDKTLELETNSIYNYPPSNNISSLHQNNKLVLSREISHRK